MSGPCEPAYLALRSDAERLPHWSSVCRLLLGGFRSAPPSRADASLRRASVWSARISMA